MANDLPLLEFWYSALREPVGIILVELSGNRHLLMNKLYEARRAANDEALMDLSICMSPTAASELWIVHKIVKVENVEASG